VSKEIQIKSKKKILKNYISTNFFFKFLKLILNPVKLFTKLKNYKSDKNLVVKIDWHQRTKKYGKYGVIDTQTPEEEFDNVTNIQKKIIFQCLKKYLNGNEKKALDFGCGNGRFSEEIVKLNSQILVLAVDTEKKLIDLAKRNNRINFLYFRKLDEIKASFDLIFISNVLGGIEKQNIIKIKDFLIRKLNKGGTLFLTEHVSKNQKKSKEILKEWSNRNDSFYLNLFKKLNLKKVDEYKYLHNFTSIYVGRK
tara:strand:+ start:1830 stop:2585 length:756 start_codon:yes stop_codon:yes gene_type:complete